MPLNNVPIIRSGTKTRLNTESKAFGEKIFFNIPINFLAKRKIKNPSINFARSVLPPSSSPSLLETGVTFDHFIVCASKSLSRLSSLSKKL